jgi:elongation factor P hydroxylase
MKEAMALGTEAAVANFIKLTEATENYDGDVTDDQKANVFREYYRVRGKQFEKQTRCQNRPIRAQAIEVLLRKNPGLSAAEIAERICGRPNRDDVKNDLAWLVSQGLVNRDTTMRPYRFSAARD